MTRPTFVEALEGLREALERASPSRPGRWNDRQRLWDDEEIVRILTRLFLRGTRVPLAARDIDNHLSGGTAGTTAKKEG